MAKNFSVVVQDRVRRVYAAGESPAFSQKVTVVVRTMLEATGIAAANLSKQRTVLLDRTDAPHTHSTGNAAQAYIDVELFQLVSDAAA